MQKNEIIRFNELNFLFEVSNEITGIQVVHPCFILLSTTKSLIQYHLSYGIISE